MKILKWVLVIVVAIIALILIVSAFLPKERTFSQSIEIEKMPRVIFNQINSLKNWENWSPFQEADTNMVSEYFGPEQGVGNRQLWKSKPNGDGSMEIIKSVNEHEVVFVLDLGMGAVDTTWFTLERTPQNVKVVWGTKMSNLGYPMGRLMMTLFSSQMDKMFQKGLENLKVYLNKQPADCASGEIEVINVPARTAIAMTGRVTMDGIETFMQNSFGGLMGVVETYRLKITGVPFAIYEGDETTVEWGVSSALPVNKVPAVLPEGVVKLDLPQTRAVCIMHTGSYNSVSDSYYKILDHIMANGMEISGDSWEEYISDPEECQDPMQLKTRICFPIK